MSSKEFLDELKQDLINSGLPRELFDYIDDVIKNAIDGNVMAAYENNSGE